MEVISLNKYIVSSLSSNLFIKLSVGAYTFNCLQKIHNILQKIACLKIMSSIVREIFLLRLFLLRFILFRDTITTPVLFIFTYINLQNILVRFYAYKSASRSKFLLHLPVIFARKVVLEVSM